MLMEKPLNKTSKWRRKWEFKVFFVFDNKYAVSGAQHEETFREKLGKSMGRRGIHLKPSAIEYHQWLIVV
jgi:hypothetical protein